ncbi:hypothetical protein HCB18_13930 [Salinispora arenicola]|nr:hypothetical protein [Salinispora arenicola]NIL63965.1 hypothetical protein [Salinispora arenicola]
MTTRLINTAKRATDKEHLLTLPQLEKASRTLARAAKVLFGELKLVETYGCIKMARSPASGRHATRAAACGDHAAARAIAGAVTGRMSRSPAEASPPRRRSALWLPAGGRDRLAPAASVVRQPG